MKKILLVLCVVALLFLAGCGEKEIEQTETRASTTQTEPETAESPMESEPQTETATEPEEVIETKTQSNSLPELSSENIESIKDALSGPSRAIARPATINSENDETSVFGIGIYNPFTKTTRFKVKEFDFIRAVDSSNNVIDVDKETAEEWLLTDLDEYILESYEKEVVPTHIKVREILDGVDAKPGSYEFKFHIYYVFEESEIKSGSFFDEFATVSLFVKVK